jgi:hypothetical protein
MEPIGKESNFQPVTTIHLKMHITVVITKIGPPKKKVVGKVGGVQAKVGGPDPATPVVASLSEVLYNQT